MTYEFRNLLMLQETPKAYRVQQTIRASTVETWIPKSVCTYKKYTPKTNSLDLNIEGWWVEKDDCKLII